MKAIHDNIDGPFVIGEDMALYGTIRGAATLRRDVRFILHGTIMGDLTIEPGSRAIIHGTVAGRIYNDGGRAEVFGMVDAVENLSSDAATIIDAAAHVRLKRASAPRSRRA
jgi:hypothetical protein